MRTFIFLILLLHGVLHLPGFIRINAALPDGVWPRKGWYWLMSFLLFTATAIVFLFDMKHWPYLGALSVGVSQYAIIMNWSRTKTGTAVNLVILILVILVACGEREFLKHNVKQTISLVVEDEEQIRYC